MKGSTTPDRLTWRRAVLGRLPSSNNCIECSRNQNGAQKGKSMKGFGKSQHTKKNQVSIKRLM